MNESRMRHSPRSFSVFVTLAMLIVGILLIQSIGYAFFQLGIPPWLVLVIIPGSLIGSMVNIPIYKVKSDSTPCTEGELVTVWGISYRVFTSSCPGETKININLGGAIIPIAVSFYLMITNFTSILGAIIAVVIVAPLVHRIARIEPNVGIVTPALLPPLIAALAAIAVTLLISGINPYVVAYVGGTLGTLIGADVLNLNKLGELRTENASIGGAGTWDGVFLTGIIAVFLI